jgi:hypothetical protein
MHHISSLPRLALMTLCVVAPLATACGPNPGELGYIGYVRYDVALEGRASRMPLAEGVEVDITIYDESGTCIDLFSFGGCPDFVAPFSLRSTNADVVETSIVSSPDGFTTHRLRTVRPGHVELHVIDAEGTFVDFLPLEVATPAMLAVSDMSYAYGWARALPPDVGIPTGIEVPLRIGVATIDGRMLLMGTQMHAHIDVREEAPGFAIGPDAPDEPPNTGFGTVTVDDDELPALLAETPLGRVPESERDHFAVRAREPGVIRVEIPSMREAIAPLSLRIASSNVSMGLLSIDVVESDLKNGVLDRVLLCARHAIDGNLQVGWPYEWQVPEGYTSQAVSHRSMRGGGNRCIVSTWDRSTSVDERSEVFGVSFGALGAEIPASVAAAHAR